MTYRVEFSAASERDLELIFDHLFESYRTFGESPGEAFAHASERVGGIRRAADRLGIFPVRGVVRDDILLGARHITIDRAIYWFDVDDNAKMVRVLAMFFGGQDHVRRMLLRLLHDAQEAPS